MAYLTQIVAVGSSAGVMFDTPLLQQLVLEIGSRVEVSVEDGALVIRAHRYVSNDEAREIGRRMIEKHRRSLERLAG